MLARDQVVLDLERKIERFLGLGVLSELQMGIDEIIERVDAILRRAPVGFRGLRRVVRRDRVLPAAEQHVGMRRHVDRMRHDGHADRVILRRGERAVDQRRIVVGVNDVMAGAWVLRLLREHLLQNLAGLELIPVGLVEAVGGGEQRQRVEDACFTIVGVALRERFHLAHIGGGARAMIELVVIGVERRERVEIVAFARSLRI